MLRVSTNRPGGCAVAVTSDVVLESGVHRKLRSRVPLGLAERRRSGVNGSRRRTILRLAKTPELCTRVTLMPVEQLGVDGAVLFADTMLPLEGMDVSLTIQPDLGLIIHEPIRDMHGVERLRARGGHRVLRRAVHARVLSRVRRAWRRRAGGDSVDAGCVSPVGRSHRRGCAGRRRSRDSGAAAVCLATRKTLAWLPSLGRCWS
jgi:hypothetical protein